MPLPAFIGLGALFSSIITGLLQFFSYIVTVQLKKIAIIVAILTAGYLAVNTLLSLLVSQIQPIIATQPTLSATLGMVLPANTQACISAIISVEIACLVYSLTIKTLTFQSRAA